MLTDGIQTETLDVPLVTRVSPTTMRRIREIAKRERRSQAQVIRIALEDFIAAREGEETANA